ncbi:hypothetical protein Q73A0000_09885 [Kaistella flava (ex Peng et al. 2021)]|uniref:Lipoprotein n=1 Tax=Kaistella flava (ex Peng et al. 2021) TaxID=2038776 RepID=A0A7M2Y954_9FLAO|nr:hypothetical protein [Kaistella flava (ex Peng et al. 2021)]QOW10661.1 hypothetical protein Q73A0000_09885 [Kaistella flava (ex Peng et al. 2021)]
MKNLLIIAISALTLVSCSSKKGIADEETLPKDIALKPDNQFSQDEEQLQMKNLITKIDSLISTETCSDATEWKFTAIGAKACGGPSSYIAYPTKLENEILPKVTQFTSMQSAFNTKYKIMSDCAMVLPPTEIKCEDGKVVLVGDQPEKKEAE